MSITITLALTLTPPPPPHNTLFIFTLELQSREMNIPRESREADTGTTIGLQLKNYVAT